MISGMLFLCVISSSLAAHIGVGISGLEGQQAVLASDYSFGQFRYWWYYYLLVPLTHFIGVDILRGFYLFMDVGLTIE